MGRYGQQSLLECVIHTTQDVADAKIIVVTWKKDGVETTLLVFNRGQTTRQPRYSFAEPSWNDRNMKVSLLITDTALEDEGSYTCAVMTDSGYGTTKTDLKVTGESLPSWLTTETFLQRETTILSQEFVFKPIPKNRHVERLNCVLDGMKIVERLRDFPGHRTGIPLKWCQLSLCLFNFLFHCDKHSHPELPVLV